MMEWKLAARRSMYQRTDDSLRLTDLHFFSFQTCQYTLATDFIRFN